MSQGWEPDEDDKKAIQFIAVKDGKIIATARCRETKKLEFKIERMATKKEHRGKGVSSGLLEYMIKEAKKNKAKRIWTISQLQAKEFYEKNGFKSISKPYDHYGQQHLDMELKE